MSYSIMTPFKDENTKNKMLDFMNRHYTPLSKLCPKYADPTWDSFPTDDMAYGSNAVQWRVGFNYNMHGFETKYAYTVCYLMALLAGDRKDFGDNKDMPYINYDGCEEWALFVNIEPDKSIGWVACDEYGFREIKPEIGFLKLVEGPRLKKVNTAIRNELIRLSIRWKLENP